MRNKVFRSLNVIIMRAFRGCVNAKESHNHLTNSICLWYNKDTKVIADSIKALQHKTETLEKTLATLKREFAEFEKQMKKRK